MTYLVCLEMRVGLGIGKLLSCVLHSESRSRQLIALNLGSSFADLVVT